MFLPDVMKFPQGLTDISQAQDWDGCEFTVIQTFDNHLWQIESSEHVELKEIPRRVSAISCFTRGTICNHNASGHWSTENHTTVNTQHIGTHDPTVTHRLMHSCCLSERTDSITFTHHEGCRSRVEQRAAYQPTKLLLKLKYSIYSIYSVIVDDNNKLCLAQKKTFCLRLHTTQKLLSDKKDEMKSVNSKVWTIQQNRSIVCGKKCCCRVLQLSFFGLSWYFNSNVGTQKK